MDCGGRFTFAVAISPAAATAFAVEIAELENGRPSALQSGTGNAKDL